MTFDKISLKVATNYLLDACYFILGSFPQLIRIPIGSDPIHFIANLFFYNYERKWLFQTKKRNLRKASIFPNIFRFTNGLCTFNNDEFENNYNKIYPDELQVKKENADSCNASFFDLAIEVNDRKFTTDLFNKRDAFPFYSNHMPDLDSNIPTKKFCRSIGSEILPTTDLINMRTHVNLLYMRM